MNHWYKSKNIKILNSLVALTFLTLPFQNCAKLTIGNGFEVEGINETSLSSALDTTPPAFKILSPLPDSYIGSSFVISGICETGMPIIWSVNGLLTSANADCINGSFLLTTSISAADGNYSLSMTQADSSGNIANEILPFKVDKTAPIVSVSSPLANTKVDVPTLNVSGSCENGFNVLITGTAILSPVAGPCTNSMFSVQVTVGGGNGTNKSLIAEQTDFAGNKGTFTRSIEVALPVGAPAIQITSPIANSWTRLLALPISGTCTAGLNVTLAGAGVQSSVQANCLSGMFSSSVQLTPGDGTKAVTASQTNSLGQMGQDSKSFKLDMTPPLVNILAPSNSVGYIGGLTISGNCETGLSVSVSGSGVTSGFSSPCTNSAYSANVTFSANTGTKTITVSQADLAGNLSTVSQNFESIPAGGLDGAQLYIDNRCNVCHGPLATSTKRNASFSAIKSALNSQPSMSNIILSDPQIQAITLALSTVATTTTLPPVTTTTVAPTTTTTLPPVTTTLPGVTTTTTTTTLPVVLPDLSVSVHSASLLESGSIVFRASLSKVTSSPVSFSFATSNGTASAGSDYTLRSGSLTIPAGTLFQDIAVSILADASDEPDEDFKLTVSAPQGATILIKSSDLAVISDDDSPALPPAPQGNFAAFQASIVKNCNSCHGNAGSPFPGIANFASLTTESAWLNSAFIVEGNATLSSVYNRTRFAGSGTKNSMPFVIPGVPDNMTLADAEAIRLYINSISGASVPVGVPQDPFSALTKIKYILNGEAPTASEINQSIVSGKLQVAPLKSLINTWMQSPAGQEKLKAFFKFIFQQDKFTNQLQPNVLFGTRGGRVGPRKDDDKKWISNIQESFSRTALDIVNNDRPFNEVLTTRRQAVTTALLVSMSYADNSQGAGLQPGTPQPLITFLGDDASGRAAILQTNHFDDWRFVNFTQAATNTESISWKNVGQIAAIPAEGNYPLYLPRVGFFTTPAFQLSWLTNDGNKFRVTTNQTLLTAIGTGISAGDSTPHGNLSGLDSAHAPPTSSCFQCHRLMDPMKETFKFRFNYGYRSNGQINSDVAIGPPMSPNLAFWGQQVTTLNSIDHLAQSLATHPLFADGWTQKLCQFATSQPCDETSSEFKRVSLAFKNSNFSFKTLVAELYSSQILIGDLVGTGGADPFVSLSRRNHFCHSLTARYNKYAQDRSYTFNPNELCLNFIAFEALPKDSMTRGTANISQPRTNNPFSFRAYEANCESAADSVVGVGKGFPTGSASQINQSTQDLVTYIMGLPSSHPRFSLSVSKNLEIYNKAISLGMTATDSMKQAFIFSCTSPDLMGVGL